eukprot:6747781-Prymnesium_polylepis.1
MERGALRLAPHSVRAVHLARGSRGHTYPSAPGAYVPGARAQGAAGALACIAGTGESTGDGRIRSACLPAA